MHTRTHTQALVVKQRERERDPSTHKQKKTNEKREDSRKTERGQRVPLKWERIVSHSLTHTHHRRKHRNRHTHSHTHIHEMRTKKTNKKWDVR